MDKQKMTNSSNGTALALGFFDGFHKGHQAILNAALKKTEDNLTPSVFTINDGEMPKFKRYGERYLIYPYGKKLFTLRVKYGFSRVYFPNFADICEMLPEEFVEEIVVKKMNAVVAICGENFTFGKNGAGNAYLLRELCAKHNITVEIIPDVTEGGEIISSSRIKTLFKNGDIVGVRKCGTEAVYESIVLEGNKVGSQLGFPTINMKFPEKTIIPRLGVYKSQTFINRETYNSITNIGIKPTLGDNEQNVPIMETHIFDFNDNVYGEPAKVTLLSFVREEHKFENLEELKIQIENDKEYVAGIE